MSLNIVRYLKSFVVLFLISVVQLGCAIDASILKNSASTRQTKISVYSKYISSSNSTELEIILKDSNDSQVADNTQAQNIVVTIVDNSIVGATVGPVSAIANNDGAYQVTLVGIELDTLDKIKLTLSGVEVSVDNIEFIAYLPLEINAPSITIPVLSGYTYRFIPSGGVAPYTYSVPAGSGSVDASGVYTAGTSGASATVRVTDSIGNTVDSSVNLVNSLTNGNVRAQVEDSYGNRYLGGDFTAVYPYPASSALAINTTSGTPELSFDLQAGFNGQVSVIVRDPTSGAIYVGGSFTTYRGATANRIAKLSAYGALDTTFNSGGIGFDGSVVALALNSTGTTLYVGGNFGTYQGVANSARSIAKLSTIDGSIDTTFHPVSASGGFSGSAGQVSTFALNSTGTTLYVGGSFTTYRGVANSAGYIAKLSTSDGSIDTTFHPVSASGGFSGSVRAILLNSTGTTLYVGGNFTTYQGVANSARYIAKLSTSDGSIDTTFHPVSASGGFSSNVNALALNSTGTTLYVGGQFSTYQGVANSARYIAKLSTSDGSIDTTFHPVSTSGGFNSSVWALALNSAGTTLYVGGYFTNYQGVVNSAYRIAKLSTIDGSIDTTFHPVSASSGFNSNVVALALNSAGTTLYVGGQFSTYQGISNNRITKILSDGRIDATFYPVSASGGFNSTVYSLALNSTGTTLYVGGQFSTYQGVANSAGYIAKLSTSDGSIDTTFHPVSASGGFNSMIFTLALNSTGTTLYVGGNFTAYQGVANSANRIAKLSTSDGSIDTTFHPVSASGGFNSTVWALALNSTGTTLYVGGSFTTYQGVANSARYIAKLSTSDGSIDTTFHPVSASGGFNSTVAALALNSTGTTLYVGGGFTMYQGVANSAGYIAKLSTSDGSIDTTFHPVSASGGFSSAVSALALNSTGTTLYVGGQFTAYQGASSARYIAKLSTSDGSIDTTFYPISASGGFNSQAYTLALNSTGTTLYVGGTFTRYRSAVCAYAGSLDTISGNLVP